MSTKMYNLYKYIPNDLFQLYDWLPVLRKWYIAHLVEEIAPLKEKVPVEKLWDMLHDATTKGYRGLFNVEASVVIYCDQGQVYIQFFGVPDEFHLDSQTFVDSHYQNQSDRPEDTSSEEWEARGDLVDRMLDRDYGGRPGHAGFVFVLANASDCMYIADRIRGK